MKTLFSPTSGKAQAAEALKTVLQQVSAVKLTDIQFDSSDPDGKIDFLANVDVFGHGYTLACKVVANEDLRLESQSLGEFREHAARNCANATPVLIATTLSQETRSLCRELQTGFLDLDGNARLEIGEIFIARQHLPLRDQEPQKSVAPSLERALQRKLPPARAEILSPDRAVVVASA